MKLPFLVYYTSTSYFRNITDSFVIRALLFSIIIISCSKSDDPYDFEWSVSSPETVGLDSKIIDSAFTEADQLGFVDAILVIKDGYLVAEKYFNSYGVNTEHQIWSCTKSFMSALIGIAIDKGFIESVDKKVMDYFPEYAYNGMDPRFYDVTIEHLLTMRMGIDKEENNLIPVVQTGDWIRETFKLPLIFDPGQKFSYNSLETHLLSAIITKVTGKSAMEFARENLMGPMGIQNFHWGSDPLGNNTGGYDIYMRPRDMAILGYLYQNGGKINDKQIVSKEWINKSLESTWVNNITAWGALTDYNYGYLWWLGKMNGYNLFMAMGMGGQYIVNFPELDMIVVATAYKDITWDNDQELPIIEIISKNILRSYN
jgi:CubicO group peptidase (beta-lactamase class C family)